MKINITLTILLLLALSIRGWSQHTAIRGQILDAQTKERIEGAIVPIEHLEPYTISDAQGQFALVNVPAGDYKLTTFLTGYKTIVLDIHVTPDADMNSVFPSKICLIPGGVRPSLIQKAGFGMKTSLSRRLILHPAHLLT